PRTLPDPSPRVILAMPPVCQVSTPLQSGEHCSCFFFPSGIASLMYLEITAHRIEPAMHFLITGAGQIGTQLVRDLTDAGHTATVLRRSSTPVPAARTHSGDAADPALLRAAADGATAIFHCIHSSYDHRAWLRDLPHRETAVMDAAAARGIPVVFPESVYAFGEGARSLAETSAPAPASPLGQVRARLLAARAAHPARTLSVVAADLIGPTAEAQSSVFQLLVM